MVQLDMHNLLLIYKAGASGPLLSLCQLLLSPILDFLVVEYCFSVPVEWEVKAIYSGT